MIRGKDVSDGIVELIAGAEVLREKREFERTRVKGHTERGPLYIFT